MPINPKFQLSFPKKKTVKNSTKDLKKSLTSIISKRWLKAAEYQGMEIIIHTGKTNCGKTFRAIQDLKKDGIKGSYLAPLRLLASEIFDTLNKEGFPCSLYTGEERKIIPNASIRSSTIEMFNFNEEYDVVVIDECQMIADSSRGSAWTNAILKVKAKKLHLIVAPHGVQIISDLLDHLGRDYTINEYERLSPLVVSKKPHPVQKPKDRTVYVVFSRTQVLLLKEYFESQGIPVSCLYGNLPPEVKRLQAQRFADGDTKIAVTSDCIGMGVNLPVDTVVIVQTEKFDGTGVRPLTASEVHQIGGRAGRYGLSNIGTVSSVDEDSLTFIKQKMEEIPETLTKVMIAPELDELKVIESERLYDKLEEWQKLNVVPQDLKYLVSNVNLANQMDLAGLITIAQQNVLGLDKALLLSMAPIPNGKYSYWMLCVEAICNGQFLPIPETITEIYSQDGIEIAETCIKEHELYMWLSNREAFNYFANRADEVYANKYVLIELLDKALMNFAKMKAKTCIYCNTGLPIGTKYKACGNCFRARSDD